MLLTLSVNFRKSLLRQCIVFLSLRLLLMQNFSVCPQRKMHQQHHRRAVRPPVVHFCAADKQKNCASEVNELTFRCTANFQETAQELKSLVMLRFINNSFLIQDRQQLANPVNCCCAVESVPASDQCLPGPERVFNVTSLPRGYVTAHVTECHGGQVTWRVGGGPGQRVHLTLYDFSSFSEDAAQQQAYRQVWDGLRAK